MSQSTNERAGGAGVATGRNAEIRGHRILVTGVTSQVGFPIARDLAAYNEIFGLTRLRSEADRERLAKAGICAVAADLVSGDLASLPAGIDYVLHFAVTKSPDGSFDRDLAANAESVGHLMARYRDAKAFLHCSTTGVYQPAGHTELRESAPLGDNHRVMMPTYSICKIAAEAVVRFSAKQWNLPTTIARLNVPYGNNGGWPALHLDWILADRPVPIHPERPNLFNPIHEDDQLRNIPALLAAASVPATIVNWGGSEAVSIEQWCTHLASLTGREARFLETDRTISSVTIDTTRMHELLGPTRVPWQEGMARLVQTRCPEALSPPRRSA